MKTSGKEELEIPETGTHGFLSKVIGKLAFLPDYALPGSVEESAGDESEGGGRLGTSLSGIVGIIFVLILASGIGYGIRRFRSKAIAGDA